MIAYETYNSDLESPYDIYEAIDLYWDLHFHRAFECILVVSGSIQCQLDSKMYAVSSGNGICIMPYQIHSIQTPKHSQIMIVRFHPEIVDFFYNRYCNQKPAHPVFSYEGIPWQHLLKSVNFYTTIGYLYQLCGRVLEQSAFLPQEDSEEDLLRHPLIYQIFNYVEEHHLQNCSLNHLAKELGYNAAYISKIFKKFTGITYINYINHRRIDYACFLIRESDASLLTIANNCGYESLRSFNRNFLTICHCTPSEYRNTRTHPTNFK